jgi:hypothetical protein
VAKAQGLYFTIDIRSLGAFRIAAASVLICDWLAPWQNLEAFYTSFGVLSIGAEKGREQCTIVLGNRRGRGNRRKTMLGQPFYIYPSKKEIPVVSGQLPE